MPNPINSAQIRFVMARENWICPVSSRANSSRGMASGRAASPVRMNRGSFDPPVRGTRTILSPLVGYPGSTSSTVYSVFAWKPFSQFITIRVLPKKDAC